MTDHDESEDTDPDAETPKLPWECPTIKSGQLFESNSLACSKSGPEVFECGQVPPWKS